MVVGRLWVSENWTQSTNPQVPSNTRIRFSASAGAGGVKGPHPCHCLYNSFYLLQQFLLCVGLQYTFKFDANYS